MVFICRLCSKYELTSSGLAIFGDTGTKRSLAYKIKLTVDVVVSQDDPLPKYVCRYCLGKLEDTFTFQEACRRAQLQLREYFLRGSLQLIDNDTRAVDTVRLPFEGISDDTGISSGTSACDTTVLSIPAEITHCAEMEVGPQEPHERNELIRSGMLKPVLNFVEITSHKHEIEMNNEIDSNIATMSTNADNSSSLLPCIPAKENSTSQSILRNDTVIHDNAASALSETKNGVEVDASALEICIKEEEIDLGCDYYEPEENLHSSSKDVGGQRQQSVITNALASALHIADVHSDPPAQEISRPIENVVVGETLSPSNLLPVKTTPSSQDMMPGSSQKDGSDDDNDICVVEIVKANKISVAQHWERYNSYFRCKKCLKIFKRRSKCESHIRTHLGIKPYQCHICKQRFRKKRQLNEHDFVHSGRKLYHCQFCVKSFRYKKNFQSHAGIHPEPPGGSHLCSFCGKVFKSQLDYWLHRTSKHVLVNIDVVVE